MNHIARIRTPGVTLSQREREIIVDALLAGQPVTITVPAEYLPPPPEPTAAQVRRSFTEPTIWSGKV